MNEVGTFSVMVRSRAPITQPKGGAGCLSGHVRIRAGGSPAMGIPTATRLVGAILLEQNDEWAVSRRYMTLESIAPLSDGVPITLPTVAA